MRYYIQEENWLLVTKKDNYLQLGATYGFFWGSGGWQNCPDKFVLLFFFGQRCQTSEKLFRVSNADRTKSRMNTFFPWSCGHRAWTIFDFKHLLFRFKLSFFLKIQWTFFVTKFSSVVRCLYVSSLEWNEDDPPPVFVVSNRPRTGFFLSKTMC